MDETLKEKDLPVPGQNDELNEDEFYNSKVESFSSVVWKRYRKHKLALFGTIVLSIMIILCILAPVITPYGRDELHMEYIQYGNPIPPCGMFPFGTDGLGRDYLTRCLYGGRTSLLIGFGATLLSVLIGVPVGCIAGYYGGIADMIIMRTIEIFSCIPSFFLLIIVCALMRPSYTNVILVLGMFGWFGIARQIRAQFLSLRNQEFVQAATALGFKDSVITFRHIMPNALMPVVISATMSVAGNIMAESGLSYLGLGVQEPEASWGSMLKLSQPYMKTAPWMMIFPGMLISIVALCINFMGDGLRDALDPRTLK